MKLTALLGVGAMAFSAALLFPPSLIAQQHRDEHGERGARHRYKLVDLGTLGGPISYGSASGPGARLLNDRGEVSSYADTALPDPFAPDNCFDADCLLAHAFRWKHGKLVDLGGLDDAFNSLGDSINDRGWVTDLLRPVSLIPHSFFRCKTQCSGRARRHSTSERCQVAALVLERS
jgi:hypothetical protein